MMVGEEEAKEWEVGDQAICYERLGARQKTRVSSGQSFRSLLCMIVHIIWGKYVDGSETLPFCLSEHLHS